MSDAMTKGEREELRRLVNERARLAGESKAMQNEWAEVNLRAQRKGGELLAEMPKNPGGRSTSDTLSQVGVERHESSRWQQVASIPEPEFEAYVAEGHSDGKELPTVEALMPAIDVAALEAGQ